MRILLVILLIFSSNVFAIGLDDIFDPITDTTKNIYNKTKEFLNLDKCSSLYTYYLFCELKTGRL